MIERYAQIWVFRKGSGTNFSTTFCVWSFKRNAYLVIFYQLTKFHCLIVFTSSDIGQYMYIPIVCYPGCEVINMKLTLSLWSTRVYTWPKSQDKSLNILRTKITFKVKCEIKGTFFTFKGLLVAKSCVRPYLECTFKSVFFAINKLTV